MISNWKIISNCCLPAFLREVLVNYASNMIRIRLNNCTICWKQREFLHGLDNLQNLLFVRAIRRFIFSFFANQNFSRDRKAELLCKSIALVLQVKFRFMGCLVKANTLVLGNIALSLSSQLIVLVFTKQPSAERYLANIFSPVFLWTFRKFLQRIKKTFRKFLESSQKTPLAKSYFSKVVGFYRSSHRRCPEKKCS